VNRSPFGDAIRTGRTCVLVSDHPVGEIRFHTRTPHAVKSLKSDG
jgi:hypothetical protein